MFTFNPMFPDATDSQKWEQIRLWRNAELRQTDWTQLVDSPVNKSAWATYRQALSRFSQHKVRSAKTLSRLGITEEEARILWR
jgi:hypothetical protein